MSSSSPATRVSTLTSSQPEMASNDTMQASKQQTIDLKESGKEANARGEEEDEEEQENWLDNEAQENVHKSVHMDPPNEEPEVRETSAEGELSRRLFATHKLEGLSKKLKGHSKLFNKSSEANKKSKRKKFQRTKKGQTQRQAITSTASYAHLTPTGSYEPSLLANAYGRPLSAALKQHFPSLAAPLNLTSAVQRLILGKFTSALSSPSNGFNSAKSSLAASQLIGPTPDASSYEHQFSSSNFEPNDDFSGWAQLPARDPYASYSGAASSPLGMAAVSENSKAAIPVEIIGLDPAVTNSILFGSGGNFFSSGSRSPSPANLDGNSRYPNTGTAAGPPTTPSVLHVHHFHMPKRPQESEQSQTEEQSASQNGESGSPQDQQEQQHHQQVYVNDKGELVYLAVDNQNPNQQQQQQAAQEAHEYPTEAGQITPSEPDGATQVGHPGRSYASNHQPAGDNKQDMVMVAYKPANQSSVYNDGQESKSSMVSTKQFAGGGGQNATSKLAEQVGGESLGSSGKLRGPSKQELEGNLNQRMPLNLRPMSSAMLRLKMHGDRPANWPLPAGSEAPFPPSNGYAGNSAGGLPLGFKNISAFLQQRQPQQQQQQSVIESLALLRRLQQHNQQQKHQLLVQQGALLPESLHNVDHELIRQFLSQTNNHLQQQQQQKFEMTQASDQLPSKFLRSHLQQGNPRNGSSNFLREHQFYHNKQQANPSPLGDRKLPIEAKLPAESADASGADTDSANLTLAFALLGSLIVMTILAVFLFYRHRRRSAGRCPNLPGRSRLNLTQRTRHFMRSNFVKPNEVTAIKSLNLDSAARGATFGAAGEDTDGESHCIAGELRGRHGALNKNKTFTGVGANLASFGIADELDRLTPEPNSSPTADIRTLNTKLHQPKPSYLKSLISSNTGEFPTGHADSALSKQPALSAGYLNVNNPKQKSYGQHAKSESFARHPEAPKQSLPFKRLVNGLEENSAANYSSFMGANLGGGAKLQEMDANPIRKQHKQQPISTSRMSTIHSIASNKLEDERELARKALARVGLKSSTETGSGTKNFPPLPASAHKLSRQLQQARAQAQFKQKTSDSLQTENL